MKVDFFFGETKQEEVILPSPLPFLSLFSPNSQKIYYVENSKVDHKISGKKHYFTDSNEANAAFKAALEADTEKTHAVPHPLRERSQRPGIAYAAAEYQYGEPTYTLRIQKLQISNIKNAAEIYFEIRIDGNIERFDHIPHANSNKLDLLTVFPKTWVRFDNLDILLQHSHTIKISVFSERFLIDKKIGVVEFELKPDDVGKVLEKSTRNKDLELTLEDIYKGLKNSVFFNIPCFRDKKVVLGQASKVAG